MHECGSETFLQQIWLQHDYQCGYILLAWLMLVSEAHCIKQPEVLVVSPLFLIPE